jgi:hypothetical protein
MAFWPYLALTQTLVFDMHNAINDCALPSLLSSSSDVKTLQVLVRTLLGSAANEGQTKTDYRVCPAIICHPQNEFSPHV